MMRRRTTEFGQLCIICEGESTENNFCKDFIEYLENNNFEGCHSKDVRILPPPREDDSEPLKGARAIQNARSINPGDALQILNGQPPLRWVETGVKALDTYSEVWVLFDNDNHPAKKEAFDLAKKERNNGKKLNIAYSSWSFEYFLIQHFEFLYHSFNYTEHRNHDVACMCCTANPKIGACNGVLEDPNKPACISGYARSKGYWNYSKTADVFSIIPNIWKGICNSHHVKWQAIEKDFEMEEKERKEIYDLNPYLDTYRVMLRLMNLKELDCYTLVETKSKLKIKVDGLDLVIFNGNDRSFVINPSNVVRCRVVIDNKEKLHYEEVRQCERQIIGVNNVYVVSLDPMNTDEFYLLDFEGDRYFLGIPPEKGDYSDEYLEKYHYSDL